MALNPTAQDANLIPSLTTPLVKYKSPPSISVADCLEVNLFHSTPLPSQQLPGPRFEEQIVMDGSEPLMIG